tara:strand:+ start:558 stop:899 length:342 start_codon:yes stop_codon:yes gene_type:complete
MTATTEAYIMPEATLGDQVYYYRHADANPELAWVTDVASRTLTLWVLTPNGGGTDRFSVHHYDDPGVLDFPAWKDYGFWKARPATKEALLSERIAALEKKVAALGTKKGKSGQ